MKKKMLTIFICLVMIAGLLPSVAFAAENYDLYVDGEQLSLVEKEPQAMTRIQRPLLCTMRPLITI